MTEVARLSFADQVLANTVGYLGTHIIENANTKLALDVLGEVLPHVNRNIGEIVRLAGVAGKLLETWDFPPGAGQSVEWGFARMDAREVVSQFLFVRAGKALDAHRDQLNKLSEQGNAA